MFMGDFMQLPLINDLPLYSSNIQPMFSFIKQTQKNDRKKSLGQLHVFK
jgi:hypothetical protein